MVRTYFESDTGSVELPAFFASISSLKTSLSISEYLQIVLASKFSEVLVSAFDLDQLDASHTDSVRQQLNSCIDAKQTVLFDSGNYESYWLRAESWTQSKFHAVLKKFPCSFAFSFDARSSSDDSKEISRAVTSSLRIDRKAADGVPIVPIVHGTPRTLPQAINYVIQANDIAMVAVPERELGVGIVERANTLLSIRSTLDRPVAIHLLGTGNPLSIVTYSLMGANSFDGLEWCQTAVDSNSGSLHHLSQGELFFDRNEHQKSGLAMGTFTLLRNLQFFADLMDEIKKRSEGRDCNAIFDTLFVQASKISRAAQL